ncbi:UbiD family decarboxylase [Paenibacillus sp. OAS669]|uniref:UbiD family decarboxylase n=1 Tax=Paenibacillus sp. OAS669 TaxID=2663821 RepID=UPI00178BD49E|nr:UbiD family decarboxylase [Paenibacillus sp. OAS669]MBE1442351.1 2,5-furandicarboxylate decarboxylase 1 [Paenibacillus sp. OAS669]
MIANSLRSWLQYMNESGQLAVVDKHVSTEFEIAALTKQYDGVKPVFFPKVSGYTTSAVAGIASTRSHFAQALGCKEEEMIPKFLEAIDHPLPTEPVSSDAAPVHEVVIDTDIDLLKLFPIPIHQEKDSGPYISAGLAIVRDPETGNQNVSIHRLQVSGPNRLGALILPRHTFNFYKKMEEKGLPLEIAIVIGVDPILMLASQAIAPLGQDELEIAGALKNAPIPVVRCKTVNIDVPAHAEIVLEGKILPKVREPEGPFGEFPAYYGAKSNKEVIEIHCVTHRKDPIYQTCLAGSDENLLLGGIPREASLLRSLKNTVPTVRNVHLTKGGKCRFHMVVSMKKRNEGEAKNVILAAFAGHYDVKKVIVVDEEIDIFDMDQVDWCLATRFQAEHDLVVVHRALGSKLDPSTDNGVGSKMGFDCTVPLSAAPNDYEVTRIPNFAEYVQNAVVTDRLPQQIVDRYFGNN